MADLLKDEDYKKVADYLKRKDDFILRKAVDLLYKTEGNYDYIFSDEYKEELKKHEDSDLEHFSNLFDKYRLEQQERKMK